MGKQIMLATLGFLFVLASTYAQTTRYFLYVTNTNTSYLDAGSANLSAYAINTSTGALTEVRGSPFVAGTYPIGIAVDPAGRFVYVANNVSVVIGGMGVFALTINSSTGALAPVGGSPYAGSSPFSVVVDPMGKFLYVANKGTSDTAGSISAYTINPSTGALTEVRGSPFVAGMYPAGITVDRTGKFLYVANSGSANASAYAINSSTGALTEVRGSPFAAGTSPAGITVDRTGKFLYVANNGSANVSAYAINTNSGSLTEVGGSPFAGSIPKEIAADPTGKFVYVANNGSDNLSVYAINPRSGALSAIDGSPFDVSTNPYCVSIAAVTGP